MPISLKETASKVTKSSSQPIAVKTVWSAEKQLLKAKKMVTVQQSVPYASVTAKKDSGKNTNLRVAVIIINDNH